MVATLPTQTSIVANRRKDDEIRRLFLKLGIGLPDDWSLDSPNSQDVLLAAAKTANLVRKQREEAEALKAPKDPTTGEGVATGLAQFSEGEDIVGMHVSAARANQIIAEDDSLPTNRTPHRPATRMSPEQARRYSDGKAAWTAPESK